MNAFLCSFSGKVAELTKKQKKNHWLVLKAIADNPRVSTWDMDTDNLWRTVYDLVLKGWLIETMEPYPWHRFIITEAGKAELNK